jgi:hypothetical protein
MILIHQEVTNCNKLQSVNSIFYYSMREINLSLRIHIF